MKYLLDTHTWLWWVRELEALPALHRDPFDRLLIAQALYEGAVLITSGPLMTQYSLKILDAST